MSAENEKFYLVNENVENGEEPVHWLVERIEEAKKQVLRIPQQYVICDRCRQIVPFDEGKDGLCKRCYIRKHGEWRRP